MKTKSTSFLLAFSMALALLLCCLSGCAKTETQPEASPAASSATQADAVSSTLAEDTEESASASAAEPESASALAAEAVTTEAQKLDRQNLDEDTAALLDGEDHEFEQEIAYRYYHDGEVRNELADTERNQRMNGSEWGFDDEGHGIFAVELDAAMQQSQWYIEYTSDYGETWFGAGMYFFVGEIADVKVSGNRVVFSVVSSVNESKYSLMYSDDLCQTFYLRDTIDFAPHYLTSVLQDEEEASHLGMSILNIDDDGSLVLGWYLNNRVSVSEFKDFNNSVRNYFLIGKMNADLTQCEVLYPTGNE